MASRRLVLGAGARTIEHFLNADTRDHAGPTARCTCGHMARYAGRRPKTFTSVLGPLHLERAYYHCAACGHGWCPRDRQMNLEGSSLTPGALRMVGLCAAEMSFGTSSEILRDIGGIAIGAKHVERAAKALGDEIDRDERAHAEPAEGADIAPTMYLGEDGTGTPMRPSEVEGRAGKQPDGSSKTRETKLCTVWTAQSRDKKGLPCRDEGSQRYNAAIESAAEPDTATAPSEHAQRVLREARRTGFDQAKRRVFIGDGAAWIWNLATTYFVGAIQIIDLFHALEKVTEATKAIYGPTSELGAAWAKVRREEVRNGLTDAVIAAFEPHAQAVDQARLCIHYLNENRHRMRYPEFRAMGLCVSSGVVEAGCRHAIGARLKRSGMRWTVRGANAITALRCAKLSGRLEDFWDRRAEAPAQKAA
jgi:hypothetical protein